MRDPADFWANVKKSDGGGCWLWTRSLSGNGYGQFWNGHKTDRTHRLAWIYTYGPIPPGQCVCHRCDNQLCVRPDHLFLGTHQDNLRDMRQKGRDFTGYHQHGEKHPLSKLNAEIVSAIRAERAGGASLRALGRKYGVWASTIHDIFRGRTWTHHQ